VTYALTPLGRDVVPVLDALREWSESHIAHIMSARSKFDRQTQVA